MTTVLTFENSRQHVSSSGPVSFSRSSWSSRHSRPYAPVTRLIPMWDLRHDSFPCETWLIWCRFRAPLGLCPTRVRMPLCAWDMTHSHVRHDSFTRETCLMYTWDMTYSYLWHASFTCETWLIWCRLCAPLRATRVRMPLWHDSFPCEICDMTHSYVRHDSFGVVFVHLFAPLASVVCEEHDSFICEPWSNYMCETWLIPVCATWLIPMCKTWLIHTWAMTHPYVRDMTHSHVRRDPFPCATWLIHT